MAKNSAESMVDAREQASAYYYLITALKERGERELAAEIVNSIQNEKIRETVGKWLR